MAGKTIQKSTTLASNNGVKELIFLLRDPPDMMSALKGGEGHGKADDMVKEVS